MYIRGKVAQYNLDGTLVRIHDSVRQAADTIGIKAISIYAAAESANRKKTAKGFRWQYVIEAFDEHKDVNSIPPIAYDRRGPKPRPVAQYGMDGKFIRAWESVHDILENNQKWNDSVLRSALSTNKK